MSAIEMLLRLSESDREELAVQLLDSLEGPADENADPEWATELQSRIDEVRSGQVKPIPWAAAREQIMDDGDG